MIKCFRVRKMKLLYATTNETKIYNMKRRLENLPIEIVTPSDLKLNIDVIENSDNASGNALKKAQAYYSLTHLPTIAADVSLYIDKVPDELQPGLYVRRVNGQVLSDEEMLFYYQKLIASVGGKTNGYYVKGLALITDRGAKTIEIKEDEFIFTSVAASKMHKGYPLDTISIDKKTNKYFVDITDDEAKNNSNNFDYECINFIKDNLL